MNKVLNIKDLKKQTVKLSVIKKKIEFLDIEENICESYVFVKKLGYNAVMDINKAFTWDFSNKDNIKVKDVNVSDLQCGRILHTICADETGTPLFSGMGEIYDLSPSLGFALHGASDEVNNFSGKSQTKSLGKTNSGVSLSSMESAEEPLKKHKVKSRTGKRPSGGTTENAGEA